MANMLKAISLLLIGGGLGAFAAGGHHRVDLQRVGDGGPEVARAKINYVHVGTHQTMAARAGSVAKPDHSSDRSEARARFAQTPGTLSDARRISVPTMRPILVGTRDTDAAAKSDGRAAEARISESIQKELKRVGCYAGAIDGDWGPETRRAMQAFNDRVNATLPTAQPDYILLTLLQGHAAKACGAACPPGQELSDGGKCLPRSVLAEERRRRMHEHTTGLQTPRAAAALSANTTGEASTDPMDNREAKILTSRQADRAERQRIAAAEQRRNQKAAEAAATAENDRLARLAAAEKARAAAELRRREELAALAARSAAKRRVAVTEPIAAETPNITTGSVATPPSPPLPVRPSSSFLQEVAMRDDARIEAEKAAPARHKASRHDSHRRPRGTRYVAHFGPPPIYRVGRLAPMPPAGFRVYAYAPRPAQRSARNPQRIFRELQYLMP